MFEYLNNRFFNRYTDWKMIRENGLANINENGIQVPQFVNIYERYDNYKKEYQQKFYYFKGTPFITGLNNNYKKFK